MASPHNAERITKSEGVKIIKMQFDEGDLEKARLARLVEIREECEKRHPVDYVFLIDIMHIIKINVNTITTRAKKLGISTYLKNRGGVSNKKALCVSAADAERIIRDYYEN